MTNITREKPGLVKRLTLFTAALLALGAAATASAQAETKKPNILVIWGDDIGGFNISAYNRGMMGYKTPNIDSIAEQGALFTDWYGQQSCTAGRAAFVTGQSPIRTGLTKVGLPGTPEGMKIEDPTIATLLKEQGYVTGQFGKNHLGDRDEMLPTNHGFDEFFGNLYHLNAEEEPENPDYPKDPEFKKKFGPRGVIHSFALSIPTAPVRAIPVRAAGARSCNSAITTKELKGGEAHTTNNRMELMAAISALEALKKPCRVDLHTDSQYVQNGISGWIKGWKKNGWRTADKKPVKNADLWQRLDAAVGASRGQVALGQGPCRP